MYVCPNDDCTNIAVPNNFENRISENKKNKTVKLKCPVCFTIFEKPIKNLYIENKRDNFPYLSASLGEFVTSRDHENALAKKMGMVPMDHLRVKKPKTRWKNKK